MVLTSPVRGLSKLRDCHEREAARLQSLLETITTPTLRARLLEQAKEHEQLAEELEEFDQG